MGIFKTRKSDFLHPKPREGNAVVMRAEAVDRFSHEILNMGDLNRDSSPIDAICAVFDLEGFTDFCAQLDPHLALPEFMNAFLPWLFTEVKMMMVQQAADDHVVLFGPLPFFAKFMGDGVMFLWNTAGMIRSDILNIPPSMYAVCLNYIRQFLPVVHRRVTNPPVKLRAGVARGRVLSVGDDADFVGPCINVAARLQKVAAGISFCCSRRGFDYESEGDQRKNSERIVLRRIAVRGISHGELVYVSKRELQSASTEVQAQFSEP